MICPCCRRPVEAPGDYLFDWGQAMISSSARPAEVVQLRRREADILEVLERRRGSAVSIESIIAVVGGAYMADFSLGSLRVSICNLRAKIAPLGLRIDTAPGGYVFRGMVRPRDATAGRYRRGVSAQRNASAISTRASSGVGASS